MNKNLLIRALFLLMGVLCYGAAIAVNITGTAWVDADNDGIVDAGETGTDFGGTMYVNVVNNATGAIIASTQVGPAGGYSFTGLPNNLTGHKLVLTNTPTNINGNRIPGTYYVAEDVVGPSNTANQANAPLLGEIALTNQAANMANQNFRMGQQGEFGCLDGIAYQVAVPSGQTVSSLYSYNVSSGVRTQIGGATTYGINSLIYSTATNNMLWGTIGNSDIVRIGPGAGTVVFHIANLPTTAFNVGVELPDSYMLVYGSNATEYYVIDVDPSRATYLELVDPANGYALKTGPNYGTTVSAPLDISDIAYLASTGLAYGITPAGVLQTLNPATGAVTTNPTAVTGLPANPYGGMFSDITGKLYAFNNTTGGFYRIDPAANTASFISGSTPSGGNDAASCPDAFVECDNNVQTAAQDTTICAGTTTSFSVAPTGNGPFTYQWQLSTDGGNNWVNMQTTPFTGPNGSYSGGNNDTLTVTPSTTGWNNYRFRCQITGNLCTAPSSAVRLQIFAVPGAPTLRASTEAPICPATTYDLNRLVLDTPPAGSTLRFYTSSTPSPATLVADPAQAPAGTYYARFENDGCTGPVSQPITITGCITPFECEDGVAYQVAAAGGETVSTLYAYNVVSGTRTQIAPLTTLVNSLIYSEVDNTLWATKNGTNTIVRIGADGTLLEYPIANLSGNFNVGTGLPGGYMLVYNTNQPRYYVIDINPSRATYLRLVDPANGYALQTSAGKSRGKG